MAKLPNLEHFHLLDAEFVYEPSDDTFLLCDAIQNEEKSIHSVLSTIDGPPIILEIGSGSGCVITFTTVLLHKLGYSNILSMATDINPKAVAMTKKTSEANGVFVEAVLADFSHGLDLKGKVDVLLFNPPYVPTPSEEIKGNGIEASWAGGVNGREVIDRFLPLIDELLSPSGMCYLLLLQENKHVEVMNLLAEMGLDSVVILKRKARNEGLFILRISRKGLNLS